MAFIYSAYTEFKVAALPYGSREPKEFTLTADTVNGQEVTVTSDTGQGVPTYLEKGTELSFSSGSTITLAEDAPEGSTTIVIESDDTAPTAGDTATTYGLVTFLGGENLTINNNDNVVSVRSFRSGIWAENAKTMVGASIDLEGTLQDDDIALNNVIRPCAFSLAREVYAQITRPNGDKYTGAFLVQSYSEPNSLDNVVRVSFTLNSQGEISVPGGIDTSTTTRGEQYVPSDQTAVPTTDGEIA